MGKLIGAALAIVLVGCAAGGDGEPGLPGLATGADTGQASGWNGVDDGSSEGASDGDSDGGSTGADADIDDQTTDDGDTEGGSESSSDDATEESSDDGAPLGDPECPPGFAVAFDVTDSAVDQLPASCAWFADALLSESDRVSLEWWGTEGQHYGPVLWDVSGHDTAIAQFQTCLGGTTNLTSEDGSWWMTLVPGDSYVFVTAAGDDVQTGAAHLYAWIANEHVGNDEIMGIDFGSIAEAWGAKDTSGDRMVGCYEL